MKIALIGSSQYQALFHQVKERLEALGHEVRMPAFDDRADFDDLGVCEYNRSIYEWADEIRMIWDGRSVGTILDFGMIFAMRKPLVIEYIETKTIRGVIEKYEKLCYKNPKGR